MLALESTSCPTLHDGELAVESATNRGCLRTKGLRQVRTMEETRSLLAECSLLTSRSCWTTQAALSRQALYFVDQLSFHGFVVSGGASGAHGGAVLGNGQGCRGAEHDQVFLDPLDAPFV